MSAGALTAANYISKQKYRSAKINILHSKDSCYYGIFQLLSKENAFNFEYLFNNPINYKYPYDVNALSETKQKFFIAATDCDTGRPAYFENKSNYQTMTKYLQASSSIPLLAEMVNIDNHMYLDGGIVDPIGIRKAMSEKYDKIVVILTRDINYTKSQFSFLKPVFSAKYKHYPCLLKSINEMDSNYNHLKKTVEIMEKRGEIFVIRPQKEVNIRRMEKRPLKHIDLYFQGIEDAESMLEQMKLYLDK